MQSDQQSNANANKRPGIVFDDVSLIYGEQDASKKGTSSKRAAGTRSAGESAAGESAAGERDAGKSSHAKESQDEALLALSHLSFEIAPGEPVAIIGPSGCGKSTTLHLVTGLLKPTSGRVLVGGEAIDKPRSETSFIPQDLGLLPWKTVYQNASLGLTIRKFPKNEVRERTMAALEQVELAGFANRFPKDLSGGMRQRLALARAIALDMDTLLMDEPLSAIDALLRESLQDTLLDLWKKRGHTQMLVTHSIEEAVYLGRRIFVLTPRPGKLVACVDNSLMGEPEYRDSKEYAEKCHEVRAILAKGVNAASEGEVAE